MHRALAAAPLAPLLASAAAIVVQDFAGELPLGLFNDGQVLYTRLAAATLVALLALASVFAWELATGRSSRVGGAARGLIVAALLVEGVVTLVDVTLVSTARGIGGGPYHEATSAAGTRVFLKRPHPGSPHGFRSMEPVGLVPAGRRVLFLGDSYTEGSGRSLDCNYPENSVARLRADARDWELMNAGVAGYGPADAAALLRFLLDEGYRFDAVVLSLFLENDFTDNLPETERRVVAGINFRFPRSRWLRWLHPLHTRTFRYAVFAVQAGRLHAAQDDSVQRGDGQCRPPAPLPDPPPDSLRSLVERRLSANYARPLAPLATGEVERALAELRAETEALDIPLVLVVFPDRILADAELRARLGIDLASDAYDPGRLRRWVREHAGGVPVVDLTELLARRGHRNYRTIDTHLSDDGNVVAGGVVGQRLGELLR